MEGGVKRMLFYVDHHEVCWQDTLGRREDSNSIIKSHRKRLPTATWIKDDSDMLLYMKKMKEFKELILDSGCNKGQGSKKLHQICDDMYASHCS